MPAAWQCRGIHLISADKRENSLLVKHNTLIFLPELLSVTHSVSQEILPNLNNPCTAQRGSYNNSPNIQLIEERL